MLENIDSNAWIIIFLISIIIFGFILMNKNESHLRRIQQLELEHGNKMNVLRNKKQTGLKSQLKGDISEMLIPWMTTKTGCTATELKHHGKPIDWIGFKGLDNENEKVSIQFIEVKSGPEPKYLKKERNGKSPLKGNELRIQEAINRKDVNHQIIYLNSKQIETHLQNIGVE